MNDLDIVYIIGFAVGFASGYFIRAMKSRLW